MTESNESQRAAFTVATAIARSKQPAIVVLPSTAEQGGRPLLLHDSSFIDRRFWPAAFPLRSLIVPVTVLGFTALLAAIGIHRLSPVAQPNPPPRTDADTSASPKQQGSSPPEQTAKVAELAQPFRSLVLDAAQSYLVTGNHPWLPIVPAWRVRTDK